MFKWVHGRKNKKGFTLLELIVVMGILAILVAMGVPKFLGQTKDANVTAMQADVKLLEQAGLQFALQNDDAFPLLGVYDEDGKFDIENGVKVEDANVLAVEGYEGGDLYYIDSELVANYVRSLKNGKTENEGDAEGAYGSYGMTKDGEVFHLNGVEGSDGSIHYGIDLKDGPEVNNPEGEE